MRLTLRHKVVEGFPPTTTTTTTTRSTTMGFMSTGRKTAYITTPQGDGRRERVHIEVTDGLAAGSPWAQFTFLDGPWEGKTVCASLDDEHTATIQTAPVSDDGFQINGEDLPGDRIPSLDGMVIILHHPYNHPSHDRHAH